MFEYNAMLKQIPVIESLNMLHVEFKAPSEKAAFEMITEYVNYLNSKSEKTYELSLIYQRN